MHDAGLMNAILALSARHLFCPQTVSDENCDPNIGIQYYNETLRYLQKATHYDSYTVSYELLSTTLIVSTYEMLDEFGTGWERHLQEIFGFNDLN
jgi:Fungal specific transcription factor domain